MKEFVEVVGVGPGLLPVEWVVEKRILGVQFLAGGERHLKCFTCTDQERFVIRNNLDELVNELANRLGKMRCMVLASGDPLFYGIGSFLLSRLPPDSLRFEPAVSSMQLAFARAGIPWQDAALASVHGRDLRTTLLPLLGRPLIGLFTRDGDSPAEVARFFLRFGLEDYEGFVGENLGTKDEQFRRFANLTDLSWQEFGPLNYLILRRTDPDSAVEAARALSPGIPDDSFVRPAEGPEVMTRQEVRCVVLGKLLGPATAGDVMWDIGAGLGTVAVEAAVLRPGLEVVAVEQDPERSALLRQNRQRFGAYNVRSVEGTAPQALELEVEPPRFVFIGGSGGKLPEILDFVAARLRVGGRLVASFVTLEHLALTRTRLREWDWETEVVELHVSRSDSLAGLTGLKPLRGVFLVCATKPEPAHA